jgi:hypothetical protein
MKSPGLLTIDVQVTPSKDKPLRPTAHYLLAIQPAESDRRAREVKVKTADPAFTAQWLVWRLPIP